MKKVTLYRCYCKVCKRFLFKFSFPSEMDLVILPCIRCQHTNFISFNKKGFGSRAIPRKDFKNHEPDGTLYEEEINEIKKNLEYEDLT